jgi:hypothetical protein
MYYNLIFFLFVKVDVRNGMYVCTLWNHLLFMATPFMLNDTCQKICTRIFRGECFVVTVLRSRMTGCAYGRSMLSLIPDWIRSTCGPEFLA